MQRASVTSRRAIASDISEVVRVINAAYRVEDFFIDGNRTNSTEMSAKLGLEGGTVLVIDAPDGCGLAGAVYLERRGDRGYFGMLSADPARQGQGIGRALIEASEAWARDAGCTALDIDVVDLRTELPAYYARFGFVTATTLPFPDLKKLKRPAHLVRMTKPIV